MRDATAQQIADLESLDRQELFRVRIEDHLGALQEYTTAGGADHDWFIGGQIVVSKESRARRAEFTLQREQVTARYRATVDAATDTLTAPGHGLAIDDLVYVTGSSLPAPLTEATLYWIVGVSGEDLQLAATEGGGAIDLTENGTVSLLKVTTLAPLMRSNPPVEKARRILVDTAIIAQDAQVTASDWEPVFEGRVDRVVFGGDASQVTVRCRDLMWRILDSWVEAEATYGSDSSPVAQETVMQQLSDDVLGPGEVTLVVPVSPAFGIVEYVQRIQSLADALQAHANWKGWDWRYRWDDGASQWQLEYYEPPRSKTVPDYTFTQDLHFRVSNVEEGDEEVRNVGLFKWDSAQPILVAEDTDSIAEFDVRRPMFFDSTGDAQISTQPRAQAVLDAAVSDTAQPPVNHEVEGPLDWRFELDDLIRWPANGVHYSSVQDTALTEIVYTLTADPETGSTMRYRGRTRPSGGTKRWLLKDWLRRQTDQVREIVPDLGAAPIVPVVRVRTSQSGSTGTVTLSISDPDGLVTATSFEPLPGGGDYSAAADPALWSEFDGTSPFGLTSSVSLVGAHVSRIAWAVRFDLGQGAGNEWVQGEAVVDANVIPDVEIQSVSRDVSTLNVLVAVKGDEDTADVRLTWTIGDGTSEPPDPIGTDTALGARSGILDLGSAAAPGQIVWVKARGEDAGGALAPLDHVAEAKHEVAGVPDGSVDNDSFAASLKIAVDRIRAQAAGFSTDIDIRPDSSNEDEIAWSTGTIWFADGSSQAITGNTSYLVDGSALTTGTWFIYWDGAQITDTQTWSAALNGDDNILLATVDRSSANNPWTVVPAVGVLGVTGPPIDTHHLRANAIKADKISANSVTATHISVADLSAISADLGTVTAGTVSANVIVASTSFSAATARFAGDVVVEGGTSVTAVRLQTTGSGAGQITLSGAASFSINIAGDLQISMSGGDIFLDDSVRVGGSLEVQGNVGFYDSTPVGKPTISGSRDNNAALADLLSSLANMGLITDSTTPT